MLEDDEEDGAPLSASYAPLPRGDDEDAIPDTEVAAAVKGPIALSMQDKWRLAKPMLMKYMLPLCEFLYDLCSYNR